MPDDTSVSVREFRANLPGLLRKVRHGESIVVTSRGQVVARVVPPGPLPDAPRPFGLLKGMIEIAPDFDEMPDDLIAAMEGNAGPMVSA
jgi:prevent-host-death family protein